MRRRGKLALHKKLRFKSNRVHHFEKNTGTRDRLSEKLSIYPPFNLKIFQ